MLFHILFSLICIFYLPASVRLLYTYIRQKYVTRDIKGFPTNFVIGNLMELVGISIEDFAVKSLAKMNELAARGESAYRIWIFHKLYVIPLNGEAAKEILQSSTETAKGNDYDFMIPWLGTGLLISSGAKWHSRRKMLTPTFHFTMLEAYVDTFNRHAHTFVELLVSASREGDVDMHPFIKRCALDIICDAAMGVELNAQRDTDQPYIRAITDYNKLALSSTMCPQVNFLPIWYLGGYKKRYDDALEILLGFTNKVIRDRKAELESKSGGEKRKRQAFLDLLLSMREENRLTDEDIREEVDTFMFEGHDTTATGMAWTVWCLANHPDCQQRCHEELDAIFGESQRPCTMEDMRQMHYLDRCIKESLRLCPPVPMYLRQLTEDMKIGDRVAPAGCQVNISAFSIHNNAQIYKEPSKYDPDRFLPEEVAKRHVYDYIPFSAGPRNCIGQKFAMYEEKVVLSRLLRSFRLSSRLPFRSNMRAPEVILRPTLGCPVVLAPR